MRFLNFIIFGKIRTPVEMRYTTLGKIPQKGIPFLNPRKGISITNSFLGLKVFTESLRYCIIFTDLHRLNLLERQKMLLQKIAVDRNITPRMFKGVQVTPENDYLESRKVLLLNNDLKWV